MATAASLEAVVPVMLHNGWRLPDLERQTLRRLIRILNHKPSA